MIIIIVVVVVDTIIIRTPSHSLKVVYTTAGAVTFHYRLFFNLVCWHEEHVLCIILCVRSGLHPC